MNTARVIIVSFSDFFYSTDKIRQCTLFHCPRLKIRSWITGKAESRNKEVLVVGFKEGFHGSSDVSADQTLMSVSALPPHWELLYKTGHSFCYLHHHHHHYHRHHHHHLSLNRDGRWCITDDFTTSFRYSSLFSTALWDLANSRPYSLMLSFHLFLCLPSLG